MRKKLLLIVMSICAISFSQSRIVLIEEFSSSTCPPCKTFNDKVFIPLLKDATMNDKFVSLSYRMDWPKPGDKYYNEESLSRKTYYSVNAIPMPFIDGVADKNSSTLDAFKKNIIEAAGKPTKTSLQIEHVITGEATNDASVTINATVSSTEDLSNAVLYIAMIEKMTTKNTGSNGEKEFHNVFMKFIPDSKGKTLSLKANTPQTFKESAALKGTNIEELSDCEVIGWIQNSNKAVVQAAASKVKNTAILTDLRKNTSVPVFKIQTSADRFRVFKAAHAIITINDLHGKQYLSAENLSETAVFDISRLPAGCYFIRVKSNSGMLAKRILISR
ncbi:MAG: Omp28-related outer membrane protein [Chitinivibrionales bacterium]|nr:Omp28-related outer membrane protein [Chitinivibrionales bacterium]